MIAAIVLGLLASSKGSGTALLLALGPAGAGGVYYALYQYYRNTNKTHNFEADTRVEAQPITGTDRKVNEVKGTSNSRIQGDNGKNDRERVERVP